MIDKNGLEDHYILKGSKKLRYGFTTGSCATAAAKGATMMLLSQRTVSHVDLMTPKGIDLHLLLEETDIDPNSASCAIRKDSGDDPDVTNGLLIYASVTKTASKGIMIDGGIGVGRVTRKGLDQPVGAAAINRVPRQMIEGAVKEVCLEYGYKGGIHVEIIVPEGMDIARRTLNSKLGIIGGISILGTSGIIEPMSEKALVDSIQLEMKMRLANGHKYLLMSPGNYGIDFTKNQLSIPTDHGIKFSNYVGETLDHAMALKVEGILFIGHIGKFIKLAGGIMNTHSRYADARMELLCASALMVGASSEVLKQIMGCVTTDEAIEILEANGIREATMEEVLLRIMNHLNHRVRNEIKMGVILFSNQHGVLAKTKNVEELVKCMENYTV